VFAASVPGSVRPRGGQLVPQARATSWAPTGINCSADRLTRRVPLAPEPGNRGKGLFALACASYLLEQLNMERMPRKCARTIGLCLLLLLVGAATGCARKKVTVTGKVTLRDKPLTSGVVTFFGEDDNPVSARIKSDGTYSASNVPVGKAKVTVTPAPSEKGVSGMDRGSDKMDPKSMGKKDGAKPSEPKKETEEDAEAVIIPPKYRTTEHSGLEYEVTNSEENTYNIPLK